MLYINPGHGMAQTRKAIGNHAIRAMGISWAMERQISNLRFQIRNYLIRRSIRRPAQRLVTAMNAVGRNLAVVVDQGCKENKFKA